MYILISNSSLAICLLSICHKNCIMLFNSIQLHVNIFTLTRQSFKIQRLPWSSSLNSIRIGFPGTSAMDVVHYLATNYYINGLHILEEYLTFCALIFGENRWMLLIMKCKSTAIEPFSTFYTLGLLCCNKYHACSIVLFIIGHLL